MYGLDKDNMFWDKFGLTMLLILIHCLVCGMAMLISCVVFSMLQSPIAGTYVGTFICGFISYLFFVEDMIEVWKI